MNTLGEKIGVIALIFTMMSVSTSPHPIILILCYGIHEAGHLTFSKLVGAKMRKMKVGVFHLSLSYDCSHLTYKSELLVQIGGVLFNLLIVLPFALIHCEKGDTLQFFMVCNISLAIMNLYPVSILDGGGIVKTILCMIFSREVAEKVSKIISFAFAILMWLVAVYLQLAFSSNLSLFFISVFLLVELCFSF